MSFVELKSVVKRYGSNTVLQDVNLNVEKGEIIAVIGRSGSGKSTMLRCINGLEPVQAGEVWVDGVAVHDATANLRELRARVGIVFQSFNLFPHLTVERNITLGPMIVKGVPAAEAAALARAALRKVGLEEKIGAYADELSGGQQQRVAIARSLAMAPSLMLFDEIASALDPELLVTHEMSFARRVAHRVVFMHQGKVWEQGPAQAFFAEPKTPELKSFLSSVIH